MPSMGKEIERRIDSPEATAIREVEGYIEKIEKGTEISQQDTQNSQNNPKFSASDLGKLSNNNQTQSSGSGSQKSIVLPLTEEKIVDGLKDSVFSGLKWLSEWCVMMIKKYPGRVFYSPTTERYD